MMQHVSHVRLTKAATDLICAVMIVTEMVSVTTYVVTLIILTTVIQLHSHVTPSQIRALLQTVTDS